MAKKAKSPASDGGTAVLEPEHEPILFSVSCAYGRAGFGKDSASVGVKFSTEVLSEANRQFFIGSSLRVSMSLDPYPPGVNRQQNLPGVEGEEYEKRELTVSAKRISVGDAEISVTLKFEKRAVSPDFLSRLAAQAGSLIVHEVITAADGEAE